ncbi:hypothetical protein GJAV_G00152900 [Gymnothorax javanicus]|nr:hypothetical protein GJAV_G00152900 [Gymnothorax javanicus]
MTKANRKIYKRPYLVESISHIFEVDHASSTRGSIMPNNQKNTARLSTVFYKLVDGIEEVRTGHLLKSPPSKRFKSLRSWKRRFFVLFKINEREYALKYFKSTEEMDKPLGGINISQITMIFSSPEKQERWEWIKKTFKCSPESVLFIRTQNRDYFLIDENNDNVEGWFQDISKAILSCSGSEQDQEKMLTQLTTKPMMTNNPEQDSDVHDWLKKGSELSQWGRELSGRSFSDPVHPLDVACSAPQYGLAEKDRSRPVSDPVQKHDLSEADVEEFSSQKQEGNEQSPPMSDNVYEEYPFNFRRRSSADSSSSDRSASEPSTTISPEPIYDTPRNLLKRFSMDSIDIEEENQEEGDCSFYMRMDKVKEIMDAIQQETEEIPAKNSGAAHDDVSKSRPGSEEIPAQGSAEVHKHLNMSQEGNEDKNPESSASAAAVKPKVCPAAMLSNWAKNKPSTASRLEPQNQSISSDRASLDVREITVNQNDLKTHLALEDVDGKPCVSNWPALPEKKCLFRKGDEILAVNDLQTETVDEVNTYLNKLLKDKQVKLTVRRKSSPEAFFPSRWGAE